jgi:hypothetical protein
LGGAVRGDGFVDVASFDAWLDFLDRSQVDQVRLLGGEPTLHPRFNELLASSQARGKRILIFSNGLIPKPALDYLETLTETQCAVLVNVNEPALDGERIHQQRCTTIQRLGKRALVGFNIHRADFQAEFLLPIITKAGCQPLIRLGMAQPCLSGDNQFIRPAQYPFIGAKIVRLAQAAAKAGVTLEFDCGFVRCMFSDRDLETLRALGADVDWRCNPILDIDITSRVIHCYPLSGFKSLPLKPRAEAAALRKKFESYTQPYRQAGVFSECSTCSLKHSGKCSGGCLAVTMRRFRHTPFSVRVSQEGVKA